jgi:hypothetical protein
MPVGRESPVRTEDQLRAALVSLEHDAPDPDAILRVVRQAARRPGRRLAWAGRGARSWHWPQLVIGIAAAAVVVLLVTLLPGGTAPHRHSGRQGIASRAGLPSAGSVGHGMLTAFSAINDDILYSVETGFTRGAVVDTYQDWSWPAQPVTGQQERWREVFAERISGGRISRAASLKLVEDDGFVYTTPPGIADSAYGRLTVVCYAAMPGGCGYGNTQTPPGAWLLRYGRFVNPNPGLEDLGPAALAHEVAHGLWRVTGRAQVNGQPVIELAETRSGRYLHYMPLPVLLWVNARTYLPVRMITGAGTPQMSQSDWYYLRPSTANMALLRVPIPAGYRQINGPAR